MIGLTVTVRVTVLFCGRWTLVGVSSTYVAAAAADGTEPPPSAGYGVVDLFANYAYNERVSGDLTVTDLFSKTYTQFLAIEPNAGLTVKAGLTLKFVAK